MNDPLYRALLGVLSAGVFAIIGVIGRWIIKTFGARKKQDLSNVEFSEKTRWECPECSMSNIGMSPCEGCGYDPLNS